jgi:choline dehydrogenase-like flavoprotein
MANMPGMTIPEDSGSGRAGLYWYPFSMDNVKWLRSSARTAHWDDIKRSNFEMIVGAKANKINFEKNKAVSVQYVSRNDSSVPPVTIKARKHVILAAGTIHTPQILMQSGIGPESILKSHNIPVVQNLPGVGSNFQDHMYIPAINYKWGIEPNGTWPTGISRRQDTPWGLSVPPFLSALFGLPVISPSRYKTLADTFEAQDPVSHLPSTYTKEQVEGYKRQQKIYAKLMREKNSQWNEMMLGQPGGTVQHLHPLSRGLVLPSTNGINNEMTVDYRALTNSIDLDVVVEEIKFMRRYMLESDLRVFNATETLPGLEVESDKDIGNWAKSTLIPSVFHPVGTAAKMPRKWGGVVDEELGVHGVEGLTIVDASIIPTLIGAPTQMSVYAIAEKVISTNTFITGCD